MTVHPFNPIRRFNLIHQHVFNSTIQSNSIQFIHTTSCRWGAPRSAPCVGRKLSELNRSFALNLSCRIKSSPSSVSAA